MLRKKARKLKSLLKEHSLYLKSRKKKDVKFIIFAQGRSGSTLLMDLFNSHPGIYCDGEIFGAQISHNVFNKYLYIKTKSEVVQEPVYGCKIKIYDLTKYQNMGFEKAKQFIHQLYKEGWKIIYLKRHNIYRQALSSLIAEERKTYHFFKNENHKNDLISIQDVESIIWRMELLEEFTKQEEALLSEIEFKKVNYEDDLLNQSKHHTVMAELFSFIGVDTVDVDTKYSRTSSDDLSQTISNYGSFVNMLKGTRFETYLDV
ncbi:MAG: hypothetical protein JXR60_02575 [Bacteroidales bacterium]|nr:hypothetical protein [Bacteroidales bacterium]